MLMQHSYIADFEDQPHSWNNQKNKKEIGVRAESKY